MTDETHDYVIVGAGSAGCVLANRLTAAGASVLLLEAGKWDRDPLIHIPIGIGKIFPERRHDWGYFMQPDPAMAGRGVECARGKVVGGSSSINVMAYVRGHPSDYDRWAAAGLSGWGYRDVLPYFRRMEHWETIHRGRRWSAATAFLRPALRRSNLRVVVKARVSGILLDGTRATGVAYTLGGQAHTARAAREVIICAGTIDTPKLLMLSGIGDPARLAAHGIATAIALPGVGQDFQDHLSVRLMHRRRDQSPFERAMRYDRLALSMVRAWAGAGGFAGDVPVGVTAFLRTWPDLPAPDIQFLFLASPFPARPYLRPFSRPVPDGYACRLSVNSVSADLTR